MYVDEATKPSKGCKASSVVASAVVASAEFFCKCIILLMAKKFLFSFKD